LGLDRREALHVSLVHNPEIAGRWESHHYASVYRAILRDELTSIVEAAGFTRVNWMQPGDSGCYQPLLLANASE
jgi:hypothetical protein